MPGDTVDIRDGAVWINGETLRENYTIGPTDPGEPVLVPRHDARQASDIFPLYAFPPDCYFVMGDNRANSLDSRFIGCIPRANIVGTPVMIYMSIDEPFSILGIRRALDRFSAYANAVLHPGEVRWRRLFRLF